MRYWLLKSEPEAYSIDDLRRDGWTHWDGVRNYQARNSMRDDFRVGDMVLYYHSRLRPPGVVGLARVTKESYPDHTSWEPGAKYFDEKSTPDEPRWFMVDIEFVEKFDRMISIDELKDHPELADMVLLNRSRLSVQPVTADQYEFIVQLAGSV